jgi:predicted acyl esterase
VWVGQWDHGSAGATTCEQADEAGHVTCRFEQWQYALHAWFDHHLKGMDVDTGPSVEAFLNGDRVSTAELWDAMPGTLELYPDATTGTLATEPPSEAGEASFTPVAGEGSIEFVSEPLEEAVLRGLPELDLVASVVGPVAHLVTTLWVEGEDGERRPANFCGVNTHLRNGVATPALTVPGQPMDLSPQCFTQAHRVAAGERLVLEVGTTSDHHVPSFATDARVTIHTGPQAGGYRLPLVEGAQLHDDVPLWGDDEDARGH